MSASYCLILFAVVHSYRQRLPLSTSRSGASEAPQPQTIVGVASSIGPSICVLGSVLYAVWKGSFGDQRIWHSHYNGVSWAAQQIVPGVGTSTDLVAGATS